jgi:hypothetical protein
MRPAVRRGLLAAILTALALLTWGRFYLIDHLHDQGWFAKYIVFADRILAGDIPRDRIGDVSPLYLWMMVALRALGLSVRAIRGLQVVALSAAAFLCGVAAKRIAGWPAAIVAGVLVLGSRAALVLSTELEPETLILVLNAAALCVIASAATSERTRRWAWPVAGLLIGLSVIARPVALGALVLMAIWAAMRSRAAAISLVAGALVPIAVVVAVNASLTGSLFIMQPGSQFYEGNNPLAIGCAGTLPRIVQDLDGGSKEPDYLHVAYRLVAARATGRPVSAPLSNRYWSAKALAFARDYPSSFARLLGWKALFAVHHYDIYDLYTTRQKALELGRYPSIPFGLAFVLSLIAFALHRPRVTLAPALFFVLATFAALVLFNVSARQRNAMLAPLAILAGVGAAKIFSLARARDERALYFFGAVMVLTPLLGIEGTPMREDNYAWWSSERTYKLEKAGYDAKAAGKMGEAITLAAKASVLDTLNKPIVPPPILRIAALVIAQESDEPQQRFDAAVALEKAGAWNQADEVLRTIESYEPRRENRAVSSVAYYRARAAVHLRAPIDVVRSLLDRAEEEAHGDPFVLALRSLLGDASASARLNELYDPFTRDYALAIAYSDLGHFTEARAIVKSLQKRFPEWNRPATLLP